MDNKTTLALRNLIRSLYPKKWYQFKSKQEKLLLNDCLYFPTVLQQALITANIKSIDDFITIVNAHIHLDNLAFNLTIPYYHIGNAKEIFA